MNVEPTSPKRSGDDKDSDPLSSPSPPPKKVIKQRASESPLSGADNDDDDDDPLTTIAIEEPDAAMQGVMQTIEVPDRGPALVFGASGPQGRAVIEGLQEHGYGPLYGATRDVHSPDARYAQDVLDVTLLQVDLADVRALEKILTETQATSIFLVTTTDMPTGNGDRADYGFQSAEDTECDTIKSFFDTLVKVHNADGLARHVVFSTLDNVKRICTDSGGGGEGGEPWIEPLEDGSICPHFTGKGRAGEYAMKLLENVDGLTLTLLTLPFLHSNFLGFCTPLPNEGGTQWSINACFAEDSVIDMLSVSDLSYIVRECMDISVQPLSSFISLSYIYSTVYSACSPWPFPFIYCFFLSILPQ